MSTPELPSLDDVAARIVAQTTSEAQRLQEQPLFEEMMAEVEKVPLHRRKYTGAEFFLREPEKWKAVVGYLAEGRGQLWIAERVGCSHHTVRAIRDAFPKAVAIEKERLANTCQQGAARLAEMILEQPEKLPPNSWAMSLGILVDKSIQLRGGPSVTIEHRHTFGHQDFNALVEAAPIDIEAQPIGSGAENAPQMAPAAPPELAAPSAPGSATTDAASLAYQRNGDAAPLPATPAPPPTPGAEGVRVFDRGGFQTRGRSPRRFHTNATTRHNPRPRPRCSTRRLQGPPQKNSRRAYAGGGLDRRAAHPLHAGWRRKNPRAPAASSRPASASRSTAAP